MRRGEGLLASLKVFSSVGQKYHILGKKVSLIAFTQVLTKLLPAAFSHLQNYVLFEKARLKLSLFNTKKCPAGFYPRIIQQVSPSLPKMSKYCSTHQVWIVPPSLESLCETLGMGENPIQQPNIYSFSPGEKFPLKDLNLSLSKVSFLPSQIAIFK